MPTHQTIQMSNGKSDNYDILIAIFDMGLSVFKNMKKLSASLHKKRAQYQKSHPKAI